MLLLLQARLLQHAVERAGWDVDSRILRDRDGSGLRRMLKLAMTALRPSKHPAVRFDHRYQRRRRAAFLRESRNGLAQQRGLAALALPGEARQCLFQTCRQIDGRLLHAIRIPYVVCTRSDCT